MNAGKHSRRLARELKADPAVSGRWLSICPACDGSGTRDWLSGAPCMQCMNGWIEDDDRPGMDDESCD